MPIVRCRKSGRLLAILGLILVPVAAHGQLVNGSFETGDFTGQNPFGLPNITDLNPGDTNISGWTVIGNELTWQQVPYRTQTPSAGNRWLDLTGAHDSQPEGGVQQVVRLRPGISYTLLFDIGANSVDGTPPLGVTTDVAGVTSQTFFNNGGAGANVWQTFSLAFTPTTAINTITLQGSESTAGTYIGLDNVRLISSAAPEPASLAPLGIVGLTVIGWRRKCVCGGRT